MDTLTEADATGPVGDVHRASPRVDNDGILSAGGTGAGQRTPGRDLDRHRRESTDGSMDHDCGTVPDSLETRGGGMVAAVSSALADAMGKGGVGGVGAKIPSAGGGRTEGSRTVRSRTKGRPATGQSHDAVVGDRR